MPFSSFLLFFLPIFCIPNKITAKNLIDFSHLIFYPECEVLFSKKHLYKEVSIFWQARFSLGERQLKSLTLGPTGCSTLSGCTSSVWTWSSPLDSWLTNPDLIKLSIRCFLFYPARKPLQLSWGWEPSCRSYCCICHCKCIRANRELIVYKFKSPVVFLWTIIIC